MCLCSITSCNFGGVHACQMAESLYWERRWQPKHHTYNFDIRKGPIAAEWFKGGRTNMCYNCLDRWVEAGRGNQACFLWEGAPPPPPPPSRAHPTVTAANGCGGGVVKRLTTTDWMQSRAGSLQRSSL